jgi:hypothetical protein
VAHCNSLVADLADDLVDPSAVDPRGTYLADIGALVAPTSRDAIPPHVRPVQDAALAQ